VQNKAKFLDGDLMRHIVVMSMSASIGLAAVFLVDFADFAFISMLKDDSLMAAVGYAGTMLYFTFSASIGLMIAGGALAAQKIGQGDAGEARRIMTSVIIVGLLMSSIVAGIVYIFAPSLIAFLGAEGDTAKHAVGYLRIVVLAMPIGAMSMMCSGLLRAHGDARRSMTVTLSGALTNAVLDPIFIFALGLGLEGAAYASVISRFAMMATALYPVFKHYGGLAKIEPPRVVKDLPPIFAIAIPAVLTNIATPIGNINVTKTISPFGDAVFAGFTAVGRITPLAFCVIFALSGAVGPIIGQNFGAKKYHRVRSTLIKAVQFTALYTLLAWALLFLLNGLISDAFNLSAGGANLVFWFAAVIAPLGVFNGTLFISNAAFNNLRRPLYSTALNWGKNTLGVLPFVIIGAQIGGAPGVLIGQAIGGVAFGCLGFWLAYRLVNKYEDGSADPDRGIKFPLMRRREDSGTTPPRP
jgi:putative MATE family efflux protein